MRILVLGGGVIGVTTAWYLAADGHQVTVVERQRLPANETSFANAGLVSPGHALSWASPRAPLMLLRSVFDGDVPLRLRLRADMRVWLWCARFFRNCTDARWRVNSLRKLALCRYSLEALGALVADTGISFHRRTGRNRVWLAHRTLPLVLAVLYVIDWLIVTTVRSWRHPRAVLATAGGTLDGLRAPIGPRRPMSWRTAWRLGRLGRPPVI